MRTEEAQRVAEHSDQAKQHAVALVRDHGLAHAHHETGIAKSTIRGWLTDEDKATLARTQHNTDQATRARQAMWHERRVELKHRLGEVAERAIAEADNQLADHDARSARDAMTTAAIAIDKAEVLSLHVDPAEHRAAAGVIEGRVVASRGRGLQLLPGGVDAKGQEAKAG